MGGCCGCKHVFHWYQWERWQHAASKDFPFSICNIKANGEAGAYALHTDISAWSSQGRAPTNITICLLQRNSDIKFLFLFFFFTPALNSPFSRSFILPLVYVLVSLIGIQELLHLPFPLSRQTKRTSFCTFYSLVISMIFSVSEFKPTVLKSVVEPNNPVPSGLFNSLSN